MPSARRTLRHFEHAGAETVDALHKQIRSLRRDVEKLSGRAGRYGHHAVDDFSSHAVDLLDDAWDAGRAVASELGRTAKSAGRAVHRDPLPVVVALGTLALVSTILLARR